MTPERFAVVNFFEVCLCGMVCPPRRLITVLYDPRAVYAIRVLDASP